MTTYFFAMCYWYAGDVLHTARCYTFDKVSCEVYFEECYRGFVPTPVRRPSIDFPPKAG